MKLLISTARSLVRKNLDEVGLNESAMYQADSNDNTSMDQTIDGTIAQAIDDVNRVAPLERLDASVVSGGATGVQVDSYGVVSFRAAHAFLRFISVRGKDSVTLNECVLDGSVEAHKQHNQYTRGTYDNPRLVIETGTSNTPGFRLYSVKAGTTAAEAIASFKYMSPATKNADNTYDISEDLQGNIIDQLTGMVLAIYGETSKAEYFLTRAKQF